MICNKCNNTVPTDSEYCPFCGNVIEINSARNEVISFLEQGYTYLELKNWKKADQAFEYAIVSGEGKSRAYMGKLLAKLKFTDTDTLSQKAINLNKYDAFKMALKYADETYKAELFRYLEECNQNLEVKKQKAKKRTAIISSISAGIVVLAVLSYFVFIPFGRIFYYKDLLVDGMAYAAAESYKSSNWFEYDKKVTYLFYESGIDFVENKNYDSAEICFEIAERYGYIDCYKYYNYSKAMSLLHNNSLEALDYFRKCGDFLDSAEIINTNEYFVMADAIQGKWRCVKAMEPVEINGKLITPFISFSLDEIIEIKGYDKLKISNDSLEYDGRAVTIIDDTHIKLIGCTFEKVQKG